MVVVVVVVVGWGVGWGLFVSLFVRPRVKLRGIVFQYEVNNCSKLHMFVITDIIFMNKGIYYV